MSEPCIIKEDKLNRLEVDVNNINDRLNRHSDKIDKISDNNLVLETILKRLEEDGKEQKQTNAMMNNTLLSVQSAMNEITFNVKELNTKLAATDKRAEEMSNKIESVDNKSKFDALPWIVKVGIPLLLGLGIGSYIMKFIK
jgi:methyl-accepting chemotaxis protein